MHILWTSHAHKTGVYTSKLTVGHYAFGRTNDESNRDNIKTTVVKAVVFPTDSSEAGDSSFYDRCSAFRLTPGLWWVPMFGQNKVCPDGVRGARRFEVGFK